MKHRTQSRQWTLIIIAVLLPAGVLIALAGRVVRQEAELAEARAVKERRNAVEQLERELSARLEAIKLQEINRWIRVPAVPDVEQPPDSALVFGAALDERDRMILPWQSPPAATEPASEFASYLQEGEALEFAKNDWAGALQLYRRALSAAGRKTERCEAMLFEARVLLKLGAAKEASTRYKSMLKDCDAANDDDGIPFALYAAERLLNALKDPGPAYTYAIDRVNSKRWMHPYEAYLIRSLLKSAPGEQNKTVLETITQRLAEIDQIRAFARDLPRIRPIAESAWAAFGPEPWLVTVIPPDPPLPSLVFVVSSRVAAQKFLPKTASLVVKDTPGTDPLREGFNGLNVKLDPTHFDLRAQAPSASLYVTGIAFILAITVLAGYLLMRDVHRGIRMAEMRSHFVASVSHELKTPLTAIRMFAETLALGRAREEKTRVEYLETIVNESERLARLVDNVLDFSKIEQGKKIYQMRPTHLPGVVRTAAQTMQYPLAQKGFTLNVSIDETIGAVAADADALEQAILNLISNAVKYSGDGREIDLCLKCTGDSAMIEVADRGIGIDPREQPRIFDEFYRGHSAEMDSIAGAGLGLTVVQHIVQAHGGRVDLRSGKGSGSTFSIRIPFVTGEAGV